MTAKKQKEKDRRRARKLAEQAWDAANDANLDLALKLMRRATETQPDNPVLWNDLGELLLQAGDEVEAERAFRAAQSLAIGYAEPYANLATIRLRQGKLEAAVALQERAVSRAPDSAVHADRLAAYRAMLGQATPSSEETMHHPPQEVHTCQPPWAERLAELDWYALGQRLTREGCLVLAGLVDADACSLARSWWDDDSLFAKTVVMEKRDFGRGTYRYLRPPLPALVDELRRAFYPHVASIANHWQQLLGESTLYPEEWEAFREVCRAAGQSDSTPILLRYEAGGFNALHRDLRGDVYFPIQLAVVLSPLLQEGEAGEGFMGGKFLFCDVPEEPHSQRRELRAGLGDAILFCTTDRLVTVGGTPRLQPVMHGVSPITSGTRLVLGIPFHEYR
jgi:hypothetical protein